MAGVAGRSGRKRKSVTAKIANGTFRSDRDGDPNLKPQPDGQPVKPAFALDEASRFWDAHVPELVSMGVATAIDSARLQMMCEAWALLRAATDAINADPLDKAARTAYSEFARQFTSAASEFGLNPSSRTRIEVKPKSVTPPFQIRSRD